MIEIEGLELLLLLIAALGFVWAPKTWTPGELVTASSMNTNVRDHLNESLRTQSTALTGTQNNFALDGPFAYLTCTNSSALEITGALIDSGNVDGARVIFEALDQAVTLKHQDAGSTSSNRFQNDTGVDIVLGQFERVWLIYDTANTIWRVGKLTTGAIVQTIGAVNLFPDPYLMMWPGGDTVAPAGATLTDDGNSSILRNTVTPYLGDMAVELKLGNTATVSSRLKWVIFASLPTAFRGKFFSFGAAIRSATASLGQLEIDDGGTGGVTKSAFHDGGDAFDWIAFTHEITADATKLEVSFLADIGAQTGGIVTALFDAITLVLGPSVPTFIIPTPSNEAVLSFPLLSTVSTVTDKFRFLSGRPFIVRNTTLRSKTGPTDADLIADVNHWDGSAFQSMYSTRPQIDDGAKNGGANPDGTYRYRCFGDQKDDESETDALISVDVDQVGSTLPGSDVEVYIRVLQFQDHFAALKAF